MPVSVFEADRQTDSTRSSSIFMYDDEDDKQAFDPTVNEERH